MATLIPAPKWPELYPWPSSLRSIRHLIKTDRGGFRTKCMVRVGGRWFINPEAFEAWIAEQHKASAE